jgi:hypothetical protein
MRCVPALEGLLSGGRFDLLVALVAGRYTASRADIAMTLLTGVHMPVVILFRFNSLNHQILTAAVTEVHAILSWAVILEYQVEPQALFHIPLLSSWLHSQSPPAKSSIR